VGAVSGALLTAPGAEIAAEGVARSALPAPARSATGSPRLPHAVVAAISGISMTMPRMQYNSAGHYRSSL
jgi:hypothetical protein